MGKPVTPTSHLKRLAILALIAFVGFLVARTLARPASWNTEVWYRSDSLTDIKNLPMYYGGNESCDACHGSVEGIKLGPGHLDLSCESCHGALADHVEGDIKIADAMLMTESEWQCMNCHQEQINRPVNFPQYRYEHGENRVRRHKSERGGRYCLDCHDAHAPELEGPVI